MIFDSQLDVMALAEDVGRHNALDKAIGKAGAVLDRQMNWEKDVFVGRLESNEIGIEVRNKHKPNLRNK